MERIARIFKQLGHPDRLRILAALRHGELTVSELTQVLALSQPRVTQYIGSLEDAGIIERLREGSWVFVRLRRGAGSPRALLYEALSLLGEADVVIAQDRERLERVRAARASAAEGFFADVANNRGQLSHDFLPVAPIETALLQAAGEGPFSRMVDLGTGSGRMLALFAERVERGTGIDSSADMLRVARHTLAGRGHITVQLGDVGATDLESGQADLLTLHHVLHYLDDPDTALAEAARLLAPGGTLLVADFAEHDRDAFRDRYAHRRLGFSADEISERLRALGFGLVETSLVSGQGDAPDVIIWQARAAAPAHRSAA